MVAAAVSTSATAAPRRSSSRNTTGMTSSAPTCGWMPVWALMSMRAMAERAPPMSACAMSPWRAASVNTARS